MTNGILVYATVQKVEKKSKINSENSVDLSEKINLDGGIGIGRVTKPGLEQKIGQAAINKVPRRMICEAVEEVCRKYEYTGNLQVRLSVPEGAEVAKKTFNPRLGIEGGISILGTTGIVEPMSEKALTDTIYLEMKMLKENGTDWCYAVPGNYGMDFLRKKLHVDTALSVKCSNYVGETIEDAKLLGMKGILLIGHIGKFYQTGSRSDEYAFQTGRLSNGSAWCACSNEWCRCSSCAGNHGLYQYNGSNGNTAKRKSG